MVRFERLSPHGSTGPINTAQASFFMSFGREPTQYFHRLEDLNLYTDVAALGSQLALQIASPKREIVLFYGI